MNHPKVQMLIDLGTNKLKQALGKAKSMVNSSTAEMKERLASIEIPAPRMGRLRAGLTKVRETINESLRRPVEVPPIKTSNLMSSLGGLKSMVIGAVGFAAIGAGIGAAISSGMEGAAQKVSFETLGGNAKGGKLYSDLTKFAQDSIFGNELYQNAQTMLAFGVSVDTVLPKLKMLGDISMGNKDRLGSLSLAYSQIMSSCVRTKVTKI
ncbi:MAG: hypothetical protein QM530_01785 [Phycisphaerales bacterium]|nr:hypothetical protein [Phycisphaerales bacterium]